MRDALIFVLGPGALGLALWTLAKLAEYWRGPARRAVLGRHNDGRDLTPEEARFIAHRALPARLREPLCVIRYVGDRSITALAREDYRGDVILAGLEILLCWPVVAGQDTEGVRWREWQP